MVQIMRISAFNEFDKIVNRIVQERKGQNIFVVLFGNENPNTGKSWCPDCVNADPLIRHHLEKTTADSVLIEVPVGTRAELHPRIQLKSIPTLIKWTENAETDKRLVESECTRDDLLSAFFTAESA
ncbi:15097_t:CDS:2 [Funneliformis caledonium]|uniref:15097_t:CDS:1 n=1 Tax=Funneliformis caledonium TaxID=1117310 RepID=A0A9N9BSX6_9GLOM|nr:15097_t:CDS:2 [Funneliformis caledonium]